MNPMVKKAQNTTLHDTFSIFISNNLKTCLKFTTVMLNVKMGVFRTTSVTESVEKLYRTRGT